MTPGRSPEIRSSSSPRGGVALAARAAPWGLFLLLLCAGWRAWDLFRTVPAYGDVLEVLWSLQWADEALRRMHGFAVYPLAFFPQGWHVTTFAGGPTLLAALYLPYRLGGPAFAYNVVTLLSLLTSFGGMLALAQRYTPRFAATLAALLFTFWGFHWVRISGHLNIALVLALLPWLAYMLDCALETSESRTRRLVTAGILWAVMMMSSWYALWLGGLLILAWLVGRALSREIRWRDAFSASLIIGGAALLLSGPWLAWFARESAAANAPFYDITHVSQWDASLNSLFAPNIHHRWLGSLARRLYHGPPNEPGQANLGLAAVTLALIGLFPAAKDRRWWPTVICATVGLVLALGVTLKWDGHAVTWPVLRPAVALLWRTGHAIKPEVFVQAMPRPEFDAAIPLPGLLLSAVVPYFERARVLARYALVGSLGVYLLTALGFTRFRRTWAQAVVAALLLFELAPPPSGAAPFPFAPHPAFEWLRTQEIGSQGIADLGSWQEGKVYMPIGGDILWATTLHGKPTLAGASSVWPAHAAFVDQWLADNPHAFANPDFAPILHAFGVRTILFHVTGGYAEEMLGEARSSPDLEETRCFEPAATAGPWPYPICVFALKPGTPGADVVFREGWSGAEEWGRWAEGTASRVEWAAPASRDYSLTLQAFPYCVADRQQRVEVLVNGEKLAEHGWQGCEEWRAEIPIPASSVRVGWNELTLQSGYALKPTDVWSDGSADTRVLSVGVSALDVRPAP